MFGLGWELSIPRISRKTEKGIPKYDDTDIFVMSGVEELIPSLTEIADPATRKMTFVPQQPLIIGDQSIQRYRPRTEGMFARIERRMNNATKEIHWRVITKDNVTSIYGDANAYRIADPKNKQHVYEWLLHETFDAFGNRIAYEYARDNPLLYSNDEPGIRLPDIFERNRNPTQLYLRRICYGNVPDPLLDDNGTSVTYPSGDAVGLLRENHRYVFEVVFDYGDWDIPLKVPLPQQRTIEEQEMFGPDPSVTTQDNPVPIREDRFSSFRSGFEIRTLRRCRRVLMFHHFAELGGPTLVRSTDFEYQTDPEGRLSLLTAATVSSYERDASGNYKSASLPPVTFGYTAFTPQAQRYQPIGARNSIMPQLDLSNPSVALVDLFGDGLPDVVVSGPDGLRYWRNLGEGILDRPRQLSGVPAAIGLHQAGVAFGDIGGDGRTDLLVHSGALPGFYETTFGEAWRTFRPYDTFPTFDLNHPNVRLVDLSGGGRSDALITDGERFTWFECLGEKGFGPPQSIDRVHDLNEFPDVFFDDPAGLVRLADMSADGLSDIVLIHNGRVDYWPNLGYGRFGKRVTMANAPRLAFDFDPKRLFLADLNGTGCADLVYVDLDCVHFWFNQNGNGWGEKQTIRGTPLATDSRSIRFADVFGTGTATIVWSYDFAAKPESNYKALDFCGGTKPYVLKEMSNNRGATTKVSYAPSTRYFLEDQANGSPWITSLPFPVQVVDKVEVIDHISKTKLVTTYKYHHGYFDGREREFRGFGRVDQFDSESFEDFMQSGLHNDDTTFTNGQSEYYVPPVETRSWFHTGVYFDEESGAEASDFFDYSELTQKFREEFFQADNAAVPLGEHLVDTGNTPQEAYRALRGAILRTEIYARDGSPKAKTPYRVTENRYRVSQIQPQDGNQHGVYFTQPMETLVHNYERNPTDPRTNHALTLDVDEFGNPRRLVAINYGRRTPDAELPAQADREKQAQTFIAYFENDYTNGIDDLTIDPDSYRTPIVSEARTYELTGFTPADGSTNFSFDEWVTNDFAAFNSANEIAYDESADLGRPQKRLVKHEITRYRRDDLADLLPTGALQSLALAGESYNIAFTSGLLANIYGNRIESGMETDGGYVSTDNGTQLWIPSGRAFYSPNPNDMPGGELEFARNHFFNPQRFRDPFGNDTLAKYDAYSLLLKQTTDCVGNQVTADCDYRLLQPFRMTDPNGNRSEVAFDTLGLVVGTAVMGKPTEKIGDRLDSSFDPNPAQAQLDAFMSAPRAPSTPIGKGGATEIVYDLLGNATSRILYDVDRFRRTGQPAFVATITRETHLDKVQAGQRTNVQIDFSHSDGFGREIQSKVQAEPGPLVEGGPTTAPRWVGSGWTIFNNKGKPVKQYEPFFDDTHEFRFGVEAGVGSTVFYDPLERVVGAVHPNHTWEKTIFEPWRQEAWDVNDTAAADPIADSDVGEFFRRLSDSEYLPTWYALRMDPTNTVALAKQFPSTTARVNEIGAAGKAGVHAATPNVVHFDSLGRAFLKVAHNRFIRHANTIEEKYTTRVNFDIEGNQRHVIDAEDRIVMKYDYNMAGFCVHHSSMEAGERWVLNDVAGKPIYAWDSRGQRFQIEYDRLHRPVKSFLRESNKPDALIGKTVYGDSLPNPEQKNQRGKVVKAFDQAGVATTDRYDFKGNLLRTARTVAEDYNRIYDWNTDAVILSWETFTSMTEYDALNRPLSTTYPDGSVYHATFNEASLLESVRARLQGTATTTAYVKSIAYNAKRQRRKVVYGNGITTSFDYDPLTFRLVRLATVRGGVRLQDFSYTNDPVGNITHIQDGAQQTIYFNNQVVGPHGDYTYDAIYRLIEAQGREHIGQASVPQTTWDDEFRTKLQHPQDGHAMRRYVEGYEYDPVGNFERMIHSATNGSWTRTYAYGESSLLEPAKVSNRLSGTTVGTNSPERYAHDAHGNMTSMPHLPHMDWDFNDRLRRIDLVGGGDVYHVYDASGKRIRKVVEKNGGTLIEERIYFGDFEVFRQHDGSGSLILERKTLHVLDATQRVALVETTTIDGGTQVPNPNHLNRYQFTNHLGSACLELDDAGQVISYEEYYPYGSTSYQAGRSAIEVSLKRYRHTGMERDEETGFAYHNARYYAPWLGRWVSADPLGIVDGTDLYVYALTTPIVFTDRSGTDSTSSSLTDEEVLAMSYAPGAPIYIQGKAPDNVGISGTTNASESSGLAGAWDFFVGVKRGEINYVVDLVTTNDYTRINDLIDSIHEKGFVATWANTQAGPILSNPGKQVAFADAVIHGHFGKAGEIAGSLEGDVSMAASGEIGAEPTTTASTAETAIDKNAGGRNVGTAKVNFWQKAEGRVHLSIETSAPGGRTLHTHQILAGPPSDLLSATRVVEFDLQAQSELKEPTSSLEYQLNNVTEAQAMQNTQLTSDFPEFSRRYNSCITTVCDVLRSGEAVPPPGSLPVPSKAAEAYGWARKVFGF